MGKPRGGIGFIEHLVECLGVVPVIAEVKKDKRRESWHYMLVMYNEDKNYLNTNGSEDFEAYFNKPSKCKADLQIKHNSRLNNCLYNKTSDDEGNVLDSITVIKRPTSGPASLPKPLDGGLTILHMQHPCRNGQSGL